MKHFRENLVVQFSVVSFGIMFALALGLSAILTARLDENVDLLRDHGVAMMSGTMIMDSAPFSIPSMVNQVSELRTLSIVITGGAFVILYGALVAIVWNGWRTFLRQRAAREAAEEATRLKSELLAKVSHELRTPINGIMGLAEMLAFEVYGTISDQQREVTRKIIDRSKVLSRIVRELLDQATFEVDIFSIKVATFTPRKLLADMHDTFDAPANHKQLALIIRIDDDVPATLNGDEGRLRQILNNLVDNAIKFTDQGAVNVLISRPHETQWAIQVSDTGMGISPK